jgi:hypothetical protein
MQMEEILVSDDACAHLEVFLYMPSKQAHLLQAAAQLHSFQQQKQAHRT